MLLKPFCIYLSHFKTKGRFNGNRPKVLWQMSSAVVIIPARYGSKRFPGKPLALIKSKPMIQHVYEKASESKLASEVYAAVDDARVFDAVKAFGGKVIMTSSAHTSGTDRIAEAVQQIPWANKVVNVQGDEPFIEPSMIDEVILLLNDPHADMSSLARKISDPESLTEPNIVKVVWDDEGFALYFSRSPIPYYRDEWADSIVLHEGIACYQHVGIYGYKRQSLLKLTSMAPHPLELAESLEQLRALASGMKIKMKETSYETLGIDDSEDIEKAEEWLSSSL